MDELTEVPAKVWTVAAWQTALGTIAVLAGTALVVLVGRDGSGQDLGRLGRLAVGLLGELCLLGVALHAARRVRAQVGGWGPALGWMRPRWSDLWWGLAWIVVQLIVGALVHAALLALLPRSTVHASSNLRSLTYHGPWWLVMALVTAAVVAPIAEETQFRGVLLRAAMSRWTFARSALVTSLFFGLLHADQAGTLGGAAVLVLRIGIFGYLQCVLVRRTGRLAPAAVSHGLNNGLGLLLALSA